MAPVSRRDTVAQSTIGFESGGGTTPATRVHGKLSIQEAWVAAGSMDRALSQVRGALHQLWQRGRTPGWSAAHDSHAGLAEVFPPCPLKIRMRRKPAATREPSAWRRTSTKVSSPRLTVPG